MNEEETETTGQATVDWCQSTGGNGLLRLPFMSAGLMEAEQLYIVSCATLQSLFTYLLLYLQAACRLAACQLNGHLRGCIVFIDADASTAQLLSGACLGKLHGSAHQVAQAVEDSLEQCANPTDFASGSLSEHAASDRDLDNASRRPAMYREGGRDLAGGAHVHREIWGATCEIGKLGSMPIALPALQTARLVAQPGIAFARSATETMRRHDSKSASAEGPQQHMQAPKLLKQHRR